MQAPPIIILNAAGTRYRCGRCGRVLLIAEFAMTPCARSCIGDRVSREGTRKSTLSLFLQPVLVALN